MPGSDIIANKKTFLLVKALEIASVEQYRELQEQFAQKEFDPEAKVKAVIEIYDQLKIRTITENLAFDYINTAFSMLDKTGALKERKKELTHFAGSLIGRER
jgi:geranylgeranyl diphosphate synthase, type II